MLLRGFLALLAAQRTCLTCDLLAGLKELLRLFPQLRLVSLLHSESSRNYESRESVSEDFQRAETQAQAEVTSKCLPQSEKHWPKALRTGTLLGKSRFDPPV